MRKISKSRADDEIISSTNGSINEEHSTMDNSLRDRSRERKDLDSDNDSNSENNDDSTLSDISKNERKQKSKGKAKKKKSEKENNDGGTEEEYEVEKIVGSKKIKGKLHYLIRWKGFSADSDTWEPENTLSCPDLINKYNDEKENEKNKEKTSANKKGKKRKTKTENKGEVKKTKKEWDSSSADANAEYEVERILEVHHKKNGRREFLIHWKGWSNKFDSWEPESNLNCPDLIKKFMDKVSSARSTDTRNLRVAPVTTNRFTLQDPTSGRRLSKRRGQRQRVRYDNAE